MASSVSSSPKIGANTRLRGTKTSFVRLCNVGQSTSTDYSELISGEGAPSGAYGRAAGTTMLYVRTDASTIATAVYVTVNGGTNWYLLIDLISLDGELGAIAGLTSGADKLPYFTGVGTASTATFTAAGRALVDDATAAAQATTLGLGTTDTPTHAGVIVGTGSVFADFLVRAVIAVADVAASNTTPLTVDLFRLDGTTALGGARQVAITAGTAQYQPAQPQEASATFSLATKGSIIASGGGWALVETNSTGEFDCTVTNTQDEALYFWCETANKISDSAKGCLVVASNSDLATWSA